MTTSEMPESAIQTVEQIRERFPALERHQGRDRRSRLARSLAGLHARGQALVERLWAGLGTMRKVTLYGPPPTRPRTPTVSFAVEGYVAEDVARLLAGRGVFVSHGHFYAITVARRLGRGEDGLVRAGCACYTTAAEVDRLVEGVASLAR
jgi:selenocysteine lyase/cysteine desulfurase